MTLPSRPSQSGFTLIEVLIAVVILALGLLGLGAVIPVVVQQQRLASDATLGTAIASSATAAVLARRDMDEAEEWSELYVGDPMTILTLANPTYWRLPNELPTDTFFDTETGDLSFSTSDPARALRIDQRLVPPPFGGQGEPEFVWDVMARLTNTGSTQLAVFVRRIDAGIRVPDGLTLSNVLTGFGNVSTAQRRVPVALSDSLRPTRDGQGVYLGVLAIEPDAYDFNDTSEDRARNKIALDTQSHTIDGVTYTEQQAWRLLSVPGQKLVDSLGNVYTVLGPDGDPDDRRVLIDPPVSAAVENAEDLGTLIFAPTPPAAVKLITVNQ